MADPIITPNPAEVTPTPTPTPTPVPTKTFTQDEVNSIIADRLARERTKIYKTIGIENEDKIPEHIAKVKEYEAIKPEYETMKSEREKSKYAEVLKASGIDDAFIEFAIGKVDKGKDLEAYKANAAAFAKENPKMLREKFQTIDASPSLGGTSKVPDFNRMTDPQIQEWLKTHNWDGSEKKR